MGVILLMVIIYMIISIFSNSNRKVKLKEEKLKEEKNDKIKQNEEQDLLKKADQALNKLFELKELNGSSIFSDEEMSHKKQEAIHQLIYIVDEEKTLEMSTVLVRLKPLIMEGFLSEEEVKKLKDSY